MKNLIFLFKFLLLTHLFTCYFLITNGQAITPPIDSHLAVDSLEQMTIMIELPDTISISEIEVVVGTSENAGDVFNLVFPLDPGSALPTNIIYFREGTKIYISSQLSEIPSLFHSQIRIKNSSNLWSSWFYYISN